MTTHTPEEEIREILNIKEKCHPLEECHWKDDVAKAIMALFSQHNTAIIKRLERIKEASDYQEYGWAELERDLDKLIQEIKQRNGKEVKT